MIDPADGFYKCFSHHRPRRRRDSIGILLVGFQVSSQQFLGAHCFQLSSSLGMRTRMRSSSLQQQQPHRLITSRQKRCTFPLQPAATSTSVEEEEYDDWEVGDAQRDLEILKTAYAKSRAKDEIDEIARMDLLDE